MLLRMLFLFPTGGLLLPKGGEGGTNTFLFPPPFQSVSEINVSGDTVENAPPLDVIFSSGSLDGRIFLFSFFLEDPSWYLPTQHLWSILYHTLPPRPINPRVTGPQTKKKYLFCLEPLQPN